MQQTKGAFLREKLVNFCNYAKELWDLDHVPADPALLPKIPPVHLAAWVKKVVLPHRGIILAKDWVAIDAVLSQSFTADIKTDKLPEKDKERVARYLECFCELVEPEPETPEPEPEPMIKSARKQ